MTRGAPGDAAEDESLLLAAARTGDEAAFAALWAAARRPAFGVCYHLTGNRADALDALQETHLAAWRGLAGGHEDAAVREELERCARLEEASAEALEALAG